MDIMLAFLVFIAAVLSCLIGHLSLIYALALGLICFFLTGVHRGYGIKALLKMILKGGKTALIVIRVLLVIGCLTALWRAGGTISLFVYYGIRLIQPNLFIIIAFLLPMVLSFVLGTSFGVVGTAGVMLMILARSGGVNPLIAAGAVMSGAYFGDRCSPASSSAFLTAAVAETDLKKYLLMMLKTSVLPVAAALGVYIFLSVRNPIGSINTDITAALQSGFNLSWYVALPAVLLIVLPWFKISIFYAMAASGLCAFLLAIFAQGQSFLSTLGACVLGYNAQSQALGSILSGGGIISMLTVMVVVLLSSTYSGIFQGTGMLRPMQEKLGALAGKIGLFQTQVVTAVFTAAVFCNQTVGTILAAQMLGQVYEDKNAPKLELAADIGSSIITIAGLVPWSIAATVPLTMMGVGSGALLFGVYLYAVPICYLATKKLWYKIY